jgi:poly(glycerol-phosphate) alpha-glucosyltransferase
MTDIELKNTLYTPDSPRAKLDKEIVGIKNAIYNLIKDGQLDMARQVFDMYKAANPSDRAITALQSLLAARDMTGLADTMRSLDGIETIFVIEKVHTVSVGTVNSLLKKVKLMEDAWGYRPLILTCDYDTGRHRRFQLYLQGDGLTDGQVSLNRGARIVNVYNYFQQAYAEHLSVITVYDPADDGSQYIKTAEKGVFEVYDSRRVLIRKEHFTGISGGLQMIEYFENNAKTKAVLFDDWGYISCVRECHPQNSGHFLAEHFYTTQGRLCITVCNDYVNDQNEINSIRVYDPEGNVIRQCADNAELAALCLSQMMREDLLYLLVFESGLMSKAAGELAAPHVSKAIVVHSVFLNDAYNPDSGPQWFYQYLCQNNEQFDGIVFLTHPQRTDFADLYNRQKGLYVIPHPYPFAVSPADFNRRDHKKAVIITRFDAYKQIDAAIDIFDIVTKQVPDARLEIYGHGVVEDALRAQIKALGLEGHVKLMGFTNDPVGVLKGAAMLMMTSLVEGFPLSVIESICNGCPAIAFDIKYGPSDIISHKKTGFLVPRFDKQQYAQHMIDYFRDTDLQKTMSRNAYAEAERFGTEAFLAQWHHFTISSTKASHLSR